MNWGHKIVLAFVFFGVFIISLVVVCVQQDFHLVSSDYYQKELSYETEINRTKNAIALVDKPQVNYVAQDSELFIHFPQVIREQGLNGQLNFFRPSNANLDFSIDLKLNDAGNQVLDLKKRMPGLWRLKLTWENGNDAYQIEKKIYL